jgi:CelD/BcsL family acetyltransferase involved in cellulose biosynthesis
MYEVRVLDDPSAWRPLAESWMRLRRPAGGRPPQVPQHPAWLETELAGHTDREAKVVALYAGSELVGVAPVLLRGWGWPLKLGPRPVARLPMRLAQLIGEGLLAPEDPAAQEVLLMGLLAAARSCDVLFLEGVPIESTLWETIRQSPAVRRSVFVEPSGNVTPRHRIVVEGTFEQFLAGRSKNTRKALGRVERGLAAPCGESLAVDRGTTPEQVPVLLRQMRVIADRSWQGRSGIGYDYADDGPSARRIAACARNGWLRAYVLRCGEQPLAFELGFQADGSYLAWDGGYDPAWAASSPGRYLQLQMLRDLFSHDAPAEVDFGYGDNHYKSSLSTHQHAETNVYLLPRSASSAVRLAVVRSFAHVNRVGRALAVPLGSLPSLRRRLRSTG